MKNLPLLVCLIPDETQHGDGTGLVTSDHGEGAAAGPMGGTIQESLAPLPTVGETVVLLHETRGAKILRAAIEHENKLTLRRQDVRSAMLADLEA